jgi:urease accessory protein
VTSAATPAGTDEILCGAPTGRFTARVVRGPRAGPVLTHLESTGVLAGRAAADCVFLVSAGAHPIGGDVVVVDLDVGEGAKLVVRSVGATLARRGPRDAGSSITSHHAHVAAGSTLLWLVEPGVAAVGACHTSSVTVTLEPSARLLWREEIVLGRHAEVTPGSWCSRMDLRRGGRPLLLAELGLGPAFPSWSSPSVLAGARAVASNVIVDPDRPEESWQAATASRGEARGAVLPLAGPGVEIVAWGDSLRGCRSVMSALLAGVGVDWLPTPEASRP